MSCQGALEIVIWDVGHGNAASARLPNGNVLMLDCGSNPDTGFSPVQATLRRWGRIDVLFISHPHMDHIGDIGSIGDPVPRVLLAPKVPDRQILEGKKGGDLETVRSYISFKSNYEPAYIDRYEVFGDVDVRPFSVNGPHEDMNAYSIVTFLRYGGFTFLHAGDLPSNHWSTLIQAHGKKFTDLLAATNFFEVSHHGRKEGYDADAMSLMGNLKLGFVSDEKEGSTSVTGRYGRYFQGWAAYNEAAEMLEDRKILTTRNDGRIYLRIDSPAAGGGQKIGVRFGGGHG